MKHFCSKGPLHPVQRLPKTATSITHHKC